MITTPSSATSQTSESTISDPLIEIVVPVYNEQGALERSIRRLHRFLRATMPWSWRIVIADNASTDATLRIAHRLAYEFDEVHVLHLDEKGRGRALRAAWSQSPADVLCYMDVDLSTDLRALLPLVAGLVSGHCELAIGTRLAPGARVVRSAKRELISRAYNLILRLALRARFTDAQCGFKAIRADAARLLLDEVRDQEWFFDTELLVLAQRRGMRIGEVAVDWVEDPDSRVDITSTALADLRGVARLAFAAPLARFLAIGAVSTIAYALLFLALRGGLGDSGADALALALTAVANTQANRTFTFGAHGRVGLLRDHAIGALVYLLTLGLSLGALGVLRDLDRHAGGLVQVAVLAAASAAATATRYFALRSRELAAARSSRQMPAVGEAGL